jgi:hypothetical protein
VIGLAARGAFYESAWRPEARPAGLREALAFAYELGQAHTVDE